MKKSKSMTTDSNLYSGDDEGFESSAEKVDYKFYLGDHDDGKVMITGNQSDPTELKTDNDEEESDSSRMTVRSVTITTSQSQTLFRSRRSRSCWPTAPTSGWRSPSSVAGS